MAVLRYKGYGFPYNPNRLEIKHTRNFVKYPILQSHVHIEEAKDDSMIVSGKGSFFGENSMAEFEQLKNLFDQGGVGQLVLPVGNIVDAYFASLIQIFESGTDALDYEFSFVCVGDIQSKLVLK